MFGIAGRRIAEALVALFALLGFAFVPLGQKTALEHTVAIFTTPAAMNAYRELANTLLGVKERLFELVRAPQGTPEGTGATEQPRGESAPPRPEVPPLPKGRL